MNDERWQRRARILGVLLAVVLFLWVPLLILYSHSESGQWELEVTFLNVGQGDGVFIETPEGIQILIDGGPDGTILRELGKVMPLWDRTIDVVIATHPDKDHVGGLVDVLKRYQVRQVVRIDNHSDTAASKSFDKGAEKEGAAIAYAQTGQVWSFGASTTLTVWSPTGDVRNWESNTASIIAQLQFGDIEFMLTGDAPSGIENYLVRTYGDVLRSEVLKLGHHGSRTSSSAEFLEAVTPLYSVVSAGTDNSYGHPHGEVVERVAAASSQLVSTAEMGRIIFKTDGRTVRLEQ
jgi:competence protein ComEC